MCERYLPPYSPDMNPIEMLWSKVKALLRKWECRTAELLPKTVSWRFCASVNGIASAGLRLMVIACNLGNCYNGVINTKSLVLSDELRTPVNSIIDKFIVLPIID